MLSPHSEPSPEVGREFLRDAHGRLLVVYRGEHGKRTEEPFQSRLGSLSFAGRETTARHYSRSPNNRVLDEHVVSPRVIAAIIEIRNPIINTPEDPFIDLSVLIEKLGRDEAHAIALRHADYIEATDYWGEIAERCGLNSVEEFIRKHPERLGDLYFNAFVLFDDNDAVAVMRK